MNWAIAMFGGITVFASLWYVLAAKAIYRPPVLIQNRDLQEVSEKNMHEVRDEKL